MENNPPATQSPTRESPIRFRNAIQRDDAIGALLDALDMEAMWGDDGPTEAGIALANRQHMDRMSAEVAIMRSACRLYQLHGGRNGPRNPVVDVMRLWELPSRALSLFGSLMVAMSNGYDDVDDWIDTIDADGDADGDADENATGSAAGSERESA